MKRPRKHSEAHLDFIRGLPCVVCKNPIQTEAAHIRFEDRKAGKRFVGMGEKPDDSWTIPLCWRHHKEQHQIGEKAFWKKVRIDPLFVSLALWRATGDDELGQQIISEHPETAGE